MGKSLVLSVSVGTGCYRHIKISENATLLKLSSDILDAFDFCDDHLHSFFMNNRAWDWDYEYTCPTDEAHGQSRLTSKHKLSEFSLEAGDKFLYIFDYGDEWRFQIKVLKILDEETKTAVVIKSVGEVSQYHDEDDGEDDW
jgi:hypothetical protein